MAPPLASWMDPPQGDLPYLTCLSFRDLQAVASDPEPTSPEEREQIEKFLEASEVGLCSATLACTPSCRRDPASRGESESGCSMRPLVTAVV